MVQTLKVQLPFQLSNESRFNLSQSDTRVRVWSPSSIHFHDRNIVEVQTFGGGNVMVWGGIRAYTKIPLVLMNGNLNSERYLNEVLATRNVPLV